MRNYLNNVFMKILENVFLLWHKRKLINTLNINDKNYESYLDIQLSRTLSKRSKELNKRCKDFIDKISTIIDLNKCNVLCIGCRNTSELDYFLGKGACSVVGIDLYSIDARISVMDMHSMKFEDSSFNLVYSSHSLEHALDPNIVAKEILRVVAPGGSVAIEVPINYNVSGADLIDFKSLDNLRSYFTSGIDTVIWENEFPFSEGYGTAVIRTLFSVRKN